MNDPTSGFFRQLQERYQENPLVTLAVSAALVAFASTPIAFAILGRMDWFAPRRGRTSVKPTFLQIVTAMLLVMSIPAIFTAIVIKASYFDEDRYEFDPNRTWTVLSQGRGLADVQAADKAVAEEMKRLAEERKNILDGVKKLDESLLALRVAAVTAPQTIAPLKDVLERVGPLRKAVGIDAPQQLEDLKAPPAEISASLSQPVYVVANANVPPAAGVPTSPAAAAAPAGLTAAQRDAEIGTVPEPQKAIAGMLPLTDLPAGWTIGKLGDKHLETFNAENLFEKIDGRAESFIQYDVRGMAYTYFHPVGDDSNELQLYIFEMANDLKALGKYGSEKPEETKPVQVGTEGYSASGSLLFRTGKYYTQIVSTKDDPKFNEFALAIAKRVAAAQGAGSASEGTKEGGESMAGPDAIFAMLPQGQGKANPKYVAQDVFGYAFLSDVFMADYEAGGSTWQGFLRPYASPEEAKAMYDKYLETVKADGAEVKPETSKDCDAMVVSSNIGLVDVVFLKGNTLGGVNGATQAKPALEFAKAFATALPPKTPALPPMEKSAEGGHE
ncbi:hypothetical protein GC170_00805 [bacterium]|nr:hypothetical protein [bacterium]